MLLFQENGPVSSHLQVVNVPILTQQECKNAYVQEQFTQNMFCAGNTEQGGQDACQVILFVNIFFNFDTHF